MTGARWLVVGAGGMLGTDLVDMLRTCDADLTALAKADLDITDAAACTAAVKGHAVVVNAAAWTDVDGAEADEPAATAVNATGPANLAAACAKTGTLLVHISTDSVFNGAATEPYPEDAPTDPINAYSRSKLAGEQAVCQLLPGTGYVVRTAWLYGAHGPNFVKTMLRLAREREIVEAVHDQRGQPTWTVALAEQIVRLGDRALVGHAPPGIYHGTAAGDATWYQFARAVFAESGHDPDRVWSITRAAFPRPAPQPAYTVLGHHRWAAALLSPMGHWRRMLADAFRAGTFKEDA